MRDARQQFLAAFFRDGWSGPLAAVPDDVLAEIRERAVGALEVAQPHTFKVAVAMREAHDAIGRNGLSPGGRIALTLHVAACGPALIIALCDEIAALRRAT